MNDFQNARTAPTSTTLPAHEAKLAEVAKKYEADTEKISTDIPVLRGVVEGVWKKEDELKALKAELSGLNRAIQLSLKPVEQGEAPPEQQVEQKISPAPDDKNPICIRGAIEQTEPQSRGHRL